MPSLRIITSNDIDTASLTASPAMSATLPVTNLKDPSRARVARTNGVISGQHVLGNFDAYKLISGMALLRHNLTQASTIRLRLYDSFNQTGNQTFDSGNVSRGAQSLGWGTFQWGIAPWGVDGFSGWAVAYTDLWFTETLAASFDLQIDDALNAVGYLEASRLFMGRYWSPANGFNWGIHMSWVDPSTQERTEGGTLRTDAFDSFRKFTMKLDWLTPSERAKLSDIVRQNGLRTDLFLSCFPGEDNERERDYAAAVKLVQNAGLSHSHVNNYRTDDLVLEEA